ncbi:PilZ domain-containing protein [Tsuneonella sp. HG094]
MERRSNDRTRTQIATICRVPATPEKAVIRDLSTTGCRLAFKHWVPVQVGTTCHIDLGSGRVVTGRVLRVDTLSCGVAFDSALDDETAADIGLNDQTATVTTQPPDEYEYPDQSQGAPHWLRGLRRLERSIDN